MDFQSKSVSEIKPNSFLAVTARPIKDLFAKTGFTHSFCIMQATKILTNDRLEFFAQQILRHFPEIEEGILWADSAFKSSLHFYSPVTKRGYLNWTSAAEEGELYWDKAVKSWDQGAFKQAYFFLGACVHLVQDLCVPHHSRLIILDGHQDYENWAEAHCNDYSVDQFGEYGLGNSPSQWIHHNAVISSELFNHVQGGAGETKFHQATSVLLPLSQRTTAGFLASFFWQMGKN